MQMQGRYDHTTSNQENVLSLESAAEHLKNSILYSMNSILVA